MIWPDFVKVRAQIPVHTKKRTFTSVHSVKSCIELCTLVTGAPEDSLVPIGELYLQNCSEGRNGVSAPKKSCLLHPILSGTEYMIATKIGKQIIF